MNMWHILVLWAVRLGLDTNYDRLEDFANHHKLVRQILGVETALRAGEELSWIGNEPKDLLRSIAFIDAKRPYTNAYPSFQNS